MKMYYVTDLRYINDENLLKEKLKIEDIMDVKRITCMINDDKISKEEFKVLSQNGARHIIKKFIPNNNMVEEIVETLEADTLTGFQMRDIMVQNHSADKIKEAIRKMTKEAQDSLTNNVMSMHLLPKSIEVEKKETEFEKKKRIGCPKYSIQQLMKECDVEIGWSHIRHVPKCDELFRWR
jgi:hypothetical protein